jgi:predicted metallo-beta-lactamase superfamily hydrolase
MAQNKQCINKSYYYLDAFVGYFTSILQDARSNYQEIFKGLMSFLKALVVVENV